MVGQLVRVRLNIAVATIVALLIVLIPAAEQASASHVGDAVRGDVDCTGVLDIVDALHIARYVVGVAQGVDDCADVNDDAIDLSHADLNDDGLIDILDALAVLRCVAGIDDCQPPQLYRITVGTGGSTEMDTDTEPNVGNAHGVRVYCTISHFSYDDPIVFAGQADATHLHIFWGNSHTDADSTAESLLAGPASSCEGGRNNLSAYWMPAVFNEASEVVLPERTITYYKSFGNDPSFDRSTIQPIPNGLAMIANEQVTNSGPWNLKVDGGPNLVRFNIGFPQCIAVDASGDPILRSEGDSDVAHLAYAMGGPNANHCPTSHPYRIPQVIYNVHYDLDIDSDWSLSSPMLHADYIAAWDGESMDRITRCNVEERRECQFRGEGGELRDQLPERFMAPDGSAVYADSDHLAPGTDRTPFGDSVTKMAP